MSKDSKIPNPTIQRLAIYSRPLEILLESGLPVMSSEKLAGLCGVNPAQVRKDLAYFGEFGIRGVGYDVRDLLQAIKGILATDREWALCIVGMGHLGSGLVQSENFKKRGYMVKAAFDSDAGKVGRKLACGLTIQSASGISQTVRKLGIEIGLITTPPHEAQRVAHLLQEGNVGAILNFTTIQIRTRKKCVIENADLSVKFENLVYHLEQLDKV
ncbi:MAG: redox-sensing transcriptional repressor Rex [Deltaproteobacteria bacterium]|nr:redox-sensing transcriptional repressor Rex [Deltaproteobacteria bacterium]